MKSSWTVSGHLGVWGNVGPSVMVLQIQSMTTHLKTKETFHFFNAIVEHICCRASSNTRCTRQREPQCNQARACADLLRWCCNRKGTKRRTWRDRCCTVVKSTPQSLRPYETHDCSGDTASAGVAVTPSVHQVWV